MQAPEAQELLIDVVVRVAAAGLGTKNDRITANRVMAVIVKGLDRAIDGRMARSAEVADVASER